MTQHDFLLWNFCDENQLIRKSTLRKTGLSEWIRFKCEDVFSRHDVHAVVPVEWPIWRLPDNPIVKAAMPKESLIRHSPVKGWGAIEKLSPQPVYTIAYDRNALMGFVSGYRDPYATGDGSLKGIALEKFADKVERLARITHIRLTTDVLPAGRAFSNSEFRKQATLSRLPLEKKPVVYRFDQRSPKEVINEGGFFVSTTVIGNNESILPSAMFSDSLESQQSGISMLVDSGITKGEIGLVVSVRKAFEYRIKDVVGVREGDYGLATEEEFITNFISSDKITAYRTTIMIEYLASKEASSIAENILANPDLPENRLIIQQELSRSPFLERKTFFGD